MLVPVVSLGRNVILTLGSQANAGTYSVAAAAVVAGGPALVRTALSAGLFAASVMVLVQKDLMDMKVTELKEELEARNEGRTGNKAWLRRALYAVIVRSYLASDDDDWDFASCHEMYARAMLHAVHGCMLCTRIFSELFGR